MDSFHGCVILQVNLGRDQLVDVKDQLVDVNLGNNLALKFCMTNGTVKIWQEVWLTVGAAVSVSSCQILALADRQLF